MARIERNNSAESDDTTDNESDDSSSSKKKKAGRLGSMLVDSPKKPEQKPAEAKPSSWQRILGEKPDKAEAPETIKPTTETSRSSRLPAPEFATVKSELSETQAETGELATDEATAITQATARGRREEVAQEKTTATSDEELRELAIAEAFLEHVETTGDIDEAAQATKAEFNLTDSELADVERSDAETEESVIDISDPHEGELPLRPAAAETDDADDEADDTAATAAGGSGAAGSGGGAGSATPPPSGGSAGGGSTPPPTGPTFTPGGAPFRGGPVPPTPNIFPSPVTNPNTSSANRLIDAEDARYYERRALQRGLVTGLIVGFLYGRRRGRIKAEKRFAPVQKKLEKQVTGLQSQVYETELALRKQAARARSDSFVRQSEQRPVAAFERVDERSTVISIPEQRRPQIERQINTIERTPRPAPERIGQVLVRGEATDRTVRAEQTPIADKTEKLNPEKQVQLMSRHELLELCEKIAVDGASLRQIYETHLVGEQGLRRIVVEHLRGGDIHKVLRRELVEREIDFERDPILRDKARASLSAGGGSQALNNLLSEAGVNNPGGEDSLIGEVTDKKVAASKRRSEVRNRRLVDGALGGTIVLLISVILFILLHR